MDYTGKRYVVEVESIADFGRFAKYRLTINLEGTSICYGPEGRHCWYVNNAQRAQRKGTRIAARLNRALEQHEARAEALQSNRKPR